MIELWIDSIHVVCKVIDTDKQTSNVIIIGICSGQMRAQLLE